MLSVLLQIHIPPTLSLSELLAYTLTFFLCFCLKAFQSNIEMMDNYEAQKKDTLF